MIYDMILEWIEIKYRFQFWIQISDLNQMYYYISKISIMILNSVGELIVEFHGDSFDFCVLMKTIFTPFCLIERN